MTPWHQQGPESRCSGRLDGDSHLLEQVMQVKLALPADDRNTCMAYRWVDARDGARGKSWSFPYINGFDDHADDGTGSGGQLGAPLASVRRCCRLLQESLLNARKAADGSDATPAGCDDSAARLRARFSRSPGIESLAYGTRFTLCSAWAITAVTVFARRRRHFHCVQRPRRAGNLRRESFERFWYHAPQARRYAPYAESQLPSWSRCEIRRLLRVGCRA